MSFTYLASPYSHHDTAVMEERFKKVCKQAAHMILKGEAVFCPIAHSHPISGHMHPDLATDTPFWEEVDAPFIRSCSKLAVLMLEGWDKSHGVAHEVRIAVERRIPIEYVAPLA